METQAAEQENKLSTGTGGEQSSDGRFSLHRLSAAFARLAGAAEARPGVPELAESFDEVASCEEKASAVGEVISPRMIVEGMLFVGNREGQPLTNRQLAANIRDVSPQEVDTLIAELNQSYLDNQTTYEIVSEGAGYRMRIRPEHEAIRRRFHGKVREAKLTTAAIEVLSVVAYRQPITAEEVARLRRSTSRAILSQLVRRGLLRLDRGEAVNKKPAYHTTERFNSLFRIGSAAELPRSEDLDDS